MNIHVYVSVSNSLIYSSGKLSNFPGFFVNNKANEGDVRLCFLKYYTTTELNLRVDEVITA